MICSHFTQFICFHTQAMEIYLHNPWLTYSIGLHRLRESGFAPDIMDDLDERPFT